MNSFCCADQPESASWNSPMAAMASSPPTLVFHPAPLLLPHLPPPMASSLTTRAHAHGRQLPLRKIPGDYGFPFLGAIKDRLDYFYGGEREEYFKSRIRKHKSTIFRANIPPGPFLADPHVVVLLDGKSFPVLFDVTKVQKRDLFLGTYMPSTDLTGGHRVLSYLDPSEPKHGQLKRLVFHLLKSRRDHVIPTFQSIYRELFQIVEENLVAKGRSNFDELNEQAAFDFLVASLFGISTASTKLGHDGPKLVSKWLLLQLGPILTLDFPKYLEDLTIHSFRLPPFLVQKDYQRLYDFFCSATSSLLMGEAQKLGISKEEACHNLLFVTCFNSFGGMKILLPNLIKWLGRAGTSLHVRLSEEIRSVIKSNGGEVSISAMDQMHLTKSVVYETLRIDPPVPMQYGKAKRDLIIENHEAAYEVKQGEMIVGYQPCATKDPKIFENAEDFVPDRFVGEGEKLLRHVLWSNGPESADPTVGNKQCAGKDFVVMVARLLLVELFLRYDSFDIEVARRRSPASFVTITSLKRSSF